MIKARESKESFYFSALTIENGLSQNSVFTVCQDSEGYLWFGTENGLNRYDGYDFKTYYTTLQDSTALSSGRIERVAEDGHKQLWVQTSYGLNRIDLQTGAVYRHPFMPKERIIALQATPRGEMLLITVHQVYRLTNNNLHALTPTKHPYHFTAVAVNNKGLLHIATSQHGVLMVNPDNPNWHPEVYPFSKDLKQIGLLHVDHENRLWAEVDSRAIVRSESKGKPFKAIPYEAYNILDKSLRTIIDLDSNYLLLGTFNGLFLLNKQSGATKVAAKNTGAPGELSYFSIYSLYKDRQGTLWVGTNLGGVNYHNHYNNRFGFIKPERFSGILSMGTEGDNGQLWFTTEGGGLLSYDRISGKQQNYLLKQEKPFFNQNILKTLCIKGDSIICSTHRGEVYLFSIRKKQFTLLRDFGQNNIPSLLCDRQGNLWMATYTNKGLVILQNGKENNQLMVNGKKTTIHFVTTLYETTSGDILIGTRYQSFYRYNPQSQQATHITASQLGLSNGKGIHIQAFFEDSSHHIWVLTQNQGIIKLDQAYHPVAPQPAPLPQGQVLYMTESPQGYFWLADQHQIYRLHPKSRTLQRFNANNGMTAQEFSPTPGLLSSEGKLYLSGNKGINTVDTRHFKMNSTPPEVQLTTLRINNQEITPDSKHSRFAMPLKTMKRLTLRHNETNIVIGYTALNYINPQNNQYIYRLDGIDTKWVEARDRREAIYSNLPAGNYLLRIKAANNDGIWNEQETVLAIRVLPPLWLRWWALLGYALFFLIILQQYILHQRRKQQLENELRLNRLEQEKNEEIHRERLRLFTHIAHEIRTPLMLLVNPVQEIATKTIHITGMREIHARIERNTQRLLSLVDNLLEIQKGETGKHSLRMSTFSLQEFLEEMYCSFRHLAEKRDITFRRVIPENALPVKYDREEMEKVIFNLLSNALKFTPAKGEVILSAEIIESRLKIKVSDTGIGMTEEEKEQLFKPFAISKKDIHGELPSSGVGLSVARYIVEQHGGKLEVENKNEHGTVMNVWLPYCPATELTEDLSLPKDTDKTNETTWQNLNLTPPSTYYKLLIIDDNEEIRDYLREQLEYAYKIKTASDGATALKMIESEGFDLIISDVMMPAPDGIELCRILKNNPELCHIPIILLTAKAMTIDLEESYQAGADDYLVKPFKIGALEARIQNILAERKRLKEVYSKRLSPESAGIHIEPADKLFMEKYIQIIKENISTPEFDIETLTHELGMSRAAFYRKIKTISNLSPAEMIRNTRLECAAELLKESQKSANEIAFQVGFNNYSHFCNCFKSVYGISPAKYKEKHS